SATRSQCCADGPGQHPFVMRLRSCARGLAGARNGAKSATKTNSETSTNPITALGFRRSRRNASDQSPPWPSPSPSREISADSSSMIDIALLPSETNSRVDEPVRDVDEQIHEDDDDHDEEDAALDHRIVAIG